MASIVLNWVTNGNNSSEIHYMVIDEDNKYLITPKRFEVNSIEDDLEKIFLANPAIKKIRCKTIVEQFNRHRLDSVLFHKYLIDFARKNNLIFEKKAKKFKGRLEKRKFRLALTRLNINLRNAQEVDLWAIYLKATKDNWERAIKTIWTMQNGSLKKKENFIKFNQFMKELE
ncbi:hypothetical protein [Legionella feeleii]|uniref:Uncharacterized protein n=1 Tax=Legionella feeleii TaxID=453 RepID=A0A378IZD6_9GAMM|nr:hypothetical protein [Legionella feeleii]STX39851.1 Uncharacterised protein [Legionella feeleii]